MKTYHIKQKLPMVLKELLVEMYGDKLQGISSVFDFHFFHLYLDRKVVLYKLECFLFI